jgi:lysozyme family protein
MSANIAPSRYYDNPTGVLLEDLQAIVKKEGGYVERASEPGGAGNFGVSFNQYKAWRALHKQSEPTLEDLKSMLPSEAVKIYANMYAPPIWYHLLNPGVAKVMLDGAVNRGVGGQIGDAQEAMGLDVDHTVGPVTLWALTHRPHDELIDQLCDFRLAKQKTFKLYDVEALPDKKPGLTWGTIWDTRVQQLRVDAHNAAKVSTGV